jgi:predicted nucleic acid-binding protein
LNPRPLLFFVILDRLTPFKGIGKSYLILISGIASDLRAKYGIKTPDAIQIATTIYGGSRSFITNDDLLKKVKEVKVLLLDDLVNAL